MKCDGKYRFTLQFPADTERRIWAGELLEQLGRARGFLLPGAQIGTERAARILLDEFRSGKLGAFTLEFPPEDTP